MQHKLDFSHNKGVISAPMDVFLDNQTLILRYSYGYGKIDLSNFNRKSKVGRARDPIMRNLVTSEALFKIVSEFDFDIYDKSKLNVILQGIGVTPNVAIELAKEILEVISIGGFLLIRDNGILSNEFTMSLRSRSNTWKGKVHFRCKMEPEEENSLRLAGFLREMISILYSRRSFDAIIIDKIIPTTKDTIICALFYTRKYNMINPRSRHSLSRRLARVREIAIRLI